MDEDDERAIELSSIAAIFPELVTDPTKPFAATLDLPITPEKPLKIYFQASTQGAPTSLLKAPPTDSTNSGDAAKPSTPAPIAAALNIDVHSLSHLPPLKIEITLPDGYPQDEPPSVVVHSEPAWLPKETLDQIQARCEGLWKECGRDQVVYTFIDYVQQAAEKAFGLADNGQDQFELSSDLKLILLDYDLKRKREQFENETFDCGVCLEPKKGRVCHRLMLCGHVFCVLCLQDFYNNCITEGDVDNVKCLDPGCGKNVAHEISPGKRRKIDRTLNPSELLQIPIEQELVQRYVRLKRKKRLEADKTTVYCPRQWCQGAARSTKHPKYDDPLHDVGEPEEEELEAEVKEQRKEKEKPEDIPMAERLCVCEDCGYAFCSVCKKGWHGELASCNPRRQAELNEEEKASLEYMRRYSTPCPTCSAPAQKTMGCNHMICFKCKTHFCYLCSSYLMPENPYEHFNNLKSTCYMRLWELEGGDGADVGLAFRGGNAIAPWEAEDWDDAGSESHGSELDDEDDFAEFGGDGVVDWNNDTDDEEPAPDQRRHDRPHIEIVNFAGNGGNRRIDLPGQALRPPAARNPPANRRGNARRRGNERRPAHRGARGMQPVQAAQPEPVAQVVVLPANRDAAGNMGDGVQVNAAPGQGNNADEGIQRFLRLALEDREDEWDSDEDGPVDPAPRVRPGNRRNHRRR